LDLQALAQVPAHRYAALHFELHPACRLLESAYPVCRIWLVSQPDYQGDEAVALDSGGDRLLLRREGFDPVVEKVCPAELALLQTLRDGGSLGAACVAARSDLPALDVSMCLQRRVADGTLAQFRCAFEEIMSAA
jgi:hypothetical protein